MPEFDLSDIPPAAIVAAAVVFALLTSGLVVKTALRWTKHDTALANEKTARSGRLIGKCENVLIITLVLLDEFTALALIFTAKSLTRRDEEADAEYLLGGTLVNVTWSILVALLGKALLAELA